MLPHDIEWTGADLLPWQRRPGRVSRFNRQPCSGRAGSGLQGPCERNLGRKAICGGCLQLAAGWGRKGGQQGGKRYGTIPPRAVVGAIGRDIDLERIRSREEASSLVDDPVGAVFQSQRCGPSRTRQQQGEHLEQNAGDPAPERRLAADERWHAGRVPYSLLVASVPRPLIFVHVQGPGPAMAAAQASSKAFSTGTRIVELRVTGIGVLVGHGRAFPLRQRSSRGPRFSRTWHSRPRASRLG